MAASKSNTHIYLHFFLFFFIFLKTSVAQVPAIYVFGDSLMDVGNNDYLKLSILKADFPHNGIDYAGGKATGRFSNGKNAADFFAEKLGLPTSPPYLSIPFKYPNKTQAFINGVSFASGGAGVLDNTNSKMCISLNKQIDYFTTVYGYLVQQMGSKLAQDHLSKSIFSIIIESNDIITYTKLLGGQTPQQLVDTLIATLRGQLKDGDCGYFKWKDDVQMTVEMNHFKESEELQVTLAENLTKAEEKIQKLKIKKKKLKKLLLDKDAASKKMEQECNLLKIELCKTVNGEKCALFAIFVSWLFFAIIMYGK